MDDSIIRIVVVALGLICLACLGGMVYLSAVGKEPPGALASTAIASVGSLVGILASPRQQTENRDRPQSEKR